MGISPPPGTPVAYAAALLPIPRIRSSAMLYMSNRFEHTLLQPDDACR